MTEERKLFEEAKRAYQASRYEYCLNRLMQKFDLKRSSTPPNVLELAAYAYGKLGYHAQSERIHRFLVRKRFPDLNRKIMDSFNIRGNDSEVPDDVPKKLKEHYFYIFEMQILHFFDRINSRDPDVLRNLAEDSKRYYAALSKWQYRRIEIVELWDRLDSYLKDIEDHRYWRNWYASAAYISWSDEKDLNFNSGMSLKLDSSLSGWCFGGGVKWENAFWIWTLDGCYAFMAGSAESQDSPPTFVQDKLSGSGLLLGPGGFWKFSKSLAIGLLTPIMWRSASYEEPIDGTIADQSWISMGYALDLRWQMAKRWGLDVKYGRAFGHDSAILLVDLKYNFGRVHE